MASKIQLRKPCETEFFLYLSNATGRPLTSGSLLCYRFINIILYSGQMAWADCTLVLPTDRVAFSDRAKHYTPKDSVVGRYIPEDSVVARYTLMRIVIINFHFFFFVIARAIIQDQFSVDVQKVEDSE